MSCQIARLSRDPRVRYNADGIASPEVLMIQHTQRAGRQRTADIQDTLSAVSERSDLERLFNRKVPLSQILRLAGREVNRERIEEILGSPDPSGDLKKLLDS